MIESEPHPLLRFAAFAARFPEPLSHSPSPEALLALLAPGAPAPLRSDDAVRAAVRDLLRHGGYKPTGRGKPSSEYLLREGAARPINLAVDVCNAVSLHSGLPISVVDLDRAKPPFRIGLARAGESYVFNPAGQTIDLDGLLCLFDSEGPCANAVKDSQRTKTSESTVAALYVIWGSSVLGDRAERAAGWAKGLLEASGARAESA